ncbi:Protein phosphatase 1 regulatory subunit 27 [Clonorchis sinensis]|uniref:Protein phosphatase 1 regulatory subunit 27 n=1 Tax=Clonorchis sinensis TaxID=79923 RepID=A0A8T1N2G2_CLOSI|nr:Protein phosphatase 1 regulatory subunit 27 [Clonorchis sinensis]
MPDVALWQLAYEGRIKELYAFIQADSQNIHITDQTGRNALHWAACGGHLDLVEKLIASGVDKDCKDQSNWTPLMIAVSAGRDQVAQFLIEEAKADVNAINSTGQCPMHYAASKNRLEIARCLLSAGARVDTRDWGGTTPLHRAVSQGNLDMVKLILEQASSTDVTNIADNEGSTPLHYACEEDNMSAIRLLLDAGASVSYENKAGKTPLDVAPDMLRLNLTKLLTETGVLQ